MLFLALLGTPVRVPLLFFDGFDGHEHLVPDTPERARQRAHPAPWMSGRVAQFEALVRRAWPAGSWPRAGSVPGQVRLALRTSNGWLYVDQDGRAFGSRAGGFDVLGYDRFARRYWPEYAGVPIVSISVRNALNRPATLFDMAGYARGSVPPRSTRELATWLGPHRLQVGSRTAVFLSDSFRRSEVATDGDGMVAIGRAGGALRIELRGEAGQ